MGYLHLPVNIPPKDFYNVDIYKTFTGLVQKYGIDPRNLKLEITETAIMEGLSRQLILLELLRNYGFEIEIDDIFQGYYYSKPLMSSDFEEKYHINSY